MADVDNETNGTTELGKLMSKLILDPKTRKDTMRLVKKIEPERALPEVDAEDAVAAAVAPIQKKLDDITKEREKEQALSNWEAKREPLRKKGLSEEEIGRVEKFMFDKQIGNHELAHQLMVQNEKVAAPRNAFGMPTLPGSGKKDDPLYQNPRQHARQTAHSIIDDLRAGKPI